MARRKRFYKCEPGVSSKRDAKIEASLIKKHMGHKTTVKSDGHGGYMVCRTYKKRR